MSRFRTAGRLAEGAELVVASNRGPRPSREGPDPGGVGGLLTGLSRALRGGRDAVWLSFGDAARARPDGARPPAYLPGSAVHVHEVDLAGTDFDAYYAHVANGVLWPLHLGMFEQMRGPPFDVRFFAAWEAYRNANRRIAAASSEHVREGGHVLVQDYHFALVPGMLRATRPDVGIGHFTHCPWADPERFAVLPARIGSELLDGMLGADVVGFYAARWAQAFLGTCASFGYRISLKDGWVRAPDGRRVLVRSYGLGVEPSELRREAASASVLQHRRRVRQYAGDRRLIVRVERMDPAKNLLRGLDAFEALLRDDPGTRGRVVQFVLACESRRRMPEYRRYEDRVVRQVDTINGRFGTSTWRPVVLERRADYALGIAAMSLADVVVVNSIRDGLNIVAKEAPIVNRRDAVLILSCDAGAVEDLGQHAVVVDPSDTAGLTEAMGKALDMTPSERRERARGLRAAAKELPPEEWLAAQRRDLPARGERRTRLQEVPSRGTDG